VAKKTSYINLIFFILSAGLLTYSVLRAIHIPITHDEACTYLYYNHENNFRCFFDASCWTWANNHLLNTLFMQASTSMFGISDLSIRLPNLIAHALYLIFSILLVKRISKNLWLQLLGFVFLNFNLYLLEFFSLNRGYGLANGLLLPALYFSVVYIDNRKLKYIPLIFGLLLLSILANFVWILAWIGIWGALILVDIQQLKQQQESLKQKLLWLIRPHLLVGAFTALLALLIYTPIRILNQKNEFSFGASSLFQMLKSHVNFSLQEQGYFGNQTVLVVLILIMAAILVSTVFSLKNIKSKATLFGLAAFWIILAVQFLQHHLLGSHYIDGRKALVLLPFLALLWMLGAKSLFSGKVSLFPKILVVIIVFFLGNHVFIRGNISRSSDWWYDQYSHELLDDLKELSDGEKLKVGLHWIYYPSIKYYQQEKQLEYFEEVKFSSEYDTLGTYPYYYISQGDLPLFAEQYEVVKKYGGASVLMVKKEVAGQRKKSLSE